MQMRFRSISLRVLLCVLTQGVLVQTYAGPLLIRNVRVFDGERVLEHRSVLVENGRIGLIGGAKLNAPGAEVIDGSGRTLLPGFFDAHVHIADDAQAALRQNLAFGVTTVLDMWASPDRLKKLKQIKAEDPPDVADVRTAGIGATAPGGHPTQMGGPPTPTTITSPGQAEGFVDARIAEGSDYIKIIHDDLRSILGADKGLPTVNNETLRALVAAAHRRGKLAVVHIGSEQDARDAIAAGADGLVHMFTGELASAGFGEFAARHGVFVIATLSVLYSACGTPNGPTLLADPRLKPYIKTEWQPFLTAPWPLLKLSCKGTREGIRQLLQARVPILAGSDSPGTGTAYGASLHGELALLVDAGLSPVQALTGATSLPARRFRLSDRGFIRPGMRADLVLVDGDPTKDILATRNIVAVFKKGIRVQR
jgi:imidazolonepropionase-like amidohydrolase